MLVKLFFRLLVVMVTLAALPGYTQDADANSKCTAFATQAIDGLKISNASHSGDERLNVLPFYYVIAFLEF